MSVHPEIGRWFAFSDVLRVGADIAISKVDDIAAMAIKVVPDLEGFSCLHASECLGRGDLVAA